MIESSLRLVGESWRGAARFGHAVERRLAHERRELLRESVVTVLDGEVKRRLGLVVLPVHQRSASARHSRLHRTIACIHRVTTCYQS